MYFFCRWLGRVYFFLRRWKIEGLNNLPATGPVILAANHSSNWDPVILGCAVNRVVHYMAKEELFKNPFLRWFLGTLHAFPVKRGAVDRRAIRQALNILECGGVLGIFPEGTRMKKGELGEPQEGIALLALKSKAPVVPVAIKGSQGGEPLQVIIGQPLTFNELYDSHISSSLLSEVSREIMGRIADLIQRDLDGLR